MSKEEFVDRLQNKAAWIDIEKTARDFEQARNEMLDCYVVLEEHWEAFVARVNESPRTELVEQRWMAVRLLDRDDELVTITVCKISFQEHDDCSHPSVIKAVRTIDHYIEHGEIGDDILKQYKTIEDLNFYGN